MKAAFFLLVAFSLVTKSAGFVVERPDGIGIDLEVDDEIGGENEDVSDFLVDSNVDTSECSTYKILKESSRAQSFQRHAGAFVCYNKGWYRFQGEVETKMANSCPKRNHCGWMVGEHPTVDQGVVRRKACFHWSNNCCSFSANIRVRNCGSFYVYKLLSNLNYHWKLKLYCGSGLADETGENSGESGSGTAAINSGEGSSPA